LDAKECEEEGVPTMAISFDPSTMNTVTTNFRETLTGKQYDHQAILKFMQADLDTQQQVIKKLSTGATPAGLAQVEATLTASTQREAAARAEPHITGEAHWWGYEVIIPEKIMREFLAAENLAATIVALLAPFVSIPALAPVGGIVAGYILAELAAMKHVDKGKGVELKALWVAPVVLVPSAL
jgi:hypothetical protein